MQTTIRIGTRREFDSEHIKQMFQLRARVFNRRLGWDVPTTDGMEIDDYDALNPHYMLIQDETSRVRGCWRLMPTEGPNMLRNTFPQLLHGAAAPAGRHIWELSRFAIDTEGEERTFGFTDLTISALQVAMTFAQRMGITRYATVTTTPIERLLRRTGVEVYRFGPPLQIGVERAVALDWVVSPQTLEALFGRMEAAA
ncbi:MULTISPECIES: acyl-homoserine-lactone synthase [Paraburkholderia]|uniref:acyl-homoserine-lactone synthase n=1 Tax=Paraburkholderia TaxID=1822464 RepID=UPI00224E6183|nr:MULTISPECIES: acyl-homoserine-lactone synthase [Paraburkholderia]MCX4162948.1 GNAT family N-acetyltransferase [Paraburkholderia megapolitana]MDN7158444.1 GNAT family N-acetyltransferase [Paraburkholderia sp. CHISQ3]MDQ6495491.1 GNAT family N-acetyltransferase [Paraburkholderia megapolitana]